MRSYILLVLMLSSFAGFGQEQRTLSGRVSDGQQSVADVTVRVAGTSSGTYTDAKGYYEIAVWPRDTVVFSSVGYKAYLKITRYENYGTPRQQSYVSVHKLQVKNLNYELLSLNNTAVVASK